MTRNGRSRVSGMGWCSGLPDTVLFGELPLLATTLLAT
jgi:hypothetical protein